MKISLGLFVLNFCILPTLLKAEYSPWIFKLNFTRLVSSVQFSYAAGGIRNIWSVLRQFDNQYQKSLNTFLFFTSATWDVCINPKQIIGRVCEINAQEHSLAYGAKY